MLGKKTNSRSVIWNCFGLKLDENGYIWKYLQDKPVCRTCRRNVSAKNGNTSNLFTHLHDHHSCLYVEASSLVERERMEDLKSSHYIKFSMTMPRIVGNLGA